MNVLSVAFAYQAPPNQESFGSGGHAIAMRLLLNGQRVLGYRSVGRLTDLNKIKWQRVSAAGQDQGDRARLSRTSWLSLTESLGIDPLGGEVLGSEVYERFLQAMTSISDSVDRFGLGSHASAEDFLAEIKGESFEVQIPYAFVPKQA